MNIAILCSGLEDTHRGYETHQRMLYDALHDSFPEDNILLFKRTGEKTLNEIPLKSPSRNSLICKLLGKITEDTSYWENFLFSGYFVIYRLLFKPAITKILVIEPGVSRTIGKLLSLFNINIEVIYTHGIASQPEYYFWHCNNIIEVNIDNYNQALSYRKEHQTSHQLHLIPHFYNPVSTASTHSNSGIKELLSIKGSKIAICVGVIHQAIKRTDHIINEFATASSEWTLILCGDILEPWIYEMGKEKLGDRLIHLKLPRDKMPDLYKHADLLVMGSINEGFGYAIIEAMSYNLPTLITDNVRNRWIIKDIDQCVDMETPGQLKNKLDEIVIDDDWFNEKALKNSETFSNHYTWSSVKKLYQSVLK